MPPILTHSLFKYYGHNTSPLENRGLKVLENLALKVTPPVEFNDPFEFTPLIKTKPPTERASDALKKILTNREFFEQNRDQFPKLRDFSDFERKVAEKRSELIKSYSAGTEKFDFNFQQNVLPEISKAFGVICFSAESSHPLMWAHYASAHTGVVLEFDQDCPLFKELGFVEVEYHCDRAPYDPAFPTDRNQIENLTRRKSPVWAYEREFRLIISLQKCTQTKSASGQTLHFLKVDPTWIKSVTVGTRASLDIKAEVNKFLRRSELKHLHANRYRMEMDAKTFSLNRKKIERF